jgi:hypothetical protein
MTQSVTWRTAPVLMFAPSGRIKTSFNYNHDFSSSWTYRGLKIPSQRAFSTPHQGLVRHIGLSLVRHIGLSTATATQIAEGRRICEIVCVQNQYNRIQRDIAEYVELSQQTDYDYLRQCEKTPARSEDQLTGRPTSRTATTVESGHQK